MSGPFYSQNPQNCLCRAPSFSSKVWSLASGSRLDVVRPSPTSASKLSSNFAFSKWGRLLDSHRLAAVLRKFCRENGGSEVWQAGLDLQGSRMLLDETSQFSFFSGWNFKSMFLLFLFISFNGVCWSGSARWSLLCETLVLEVKYRLLWKYLLLSNYRLSRKYLQVLKYSALWKYWLLQIFM